MTDVVDEISSIVQRCYETALSERRTTRHVAADLVDALVDGPLLRALASEFLVDAVARASRARTLELEREAQVQREQQLAEQARSSTMGERRRRWQEEREAEEIRSFQMFHGVIGKALDRYAEDLRVRWTAELLDATFALGDGTLVTWGEATAEQHAERRQMFLNNAHANMEGAARHELALRELEASGKATLREMVGVAA